VLLIGKEKHQFVLNTAVVQRQPLSLQWNFPLISVM
jgi:hypothetical protein